MKNEYTQMVVNMIQYLEVILKCLILTRRKHSPKKNLIPYL